MRMRSCGRLVARNRSIVCSTTGLMGGLTTYSAFSYETVRLMEANAWHQAWVNIIVTTTICLSLCFLGIAAGRLILTLRG